MPVLLSPAGGTTILLFGPQALSFDQDSFSQLRSTLLNTPCHRWILDTIEELPECWDALSKAYPKIQAVPGAKLLGKLNDSLRTCMLKQEDFPMPNILLTPLVVITHLTQYAKYFELAPADEREQHDLIACFKQRTETLGFCTGLLSALAVSSSATQNQFQKYGAVAVRLAMLIGAVVDAQDRSSDLCGESLSFSATWNSTESSAEMTRILDRFADVRFQPWLARHEQLHGH